jgi:VWFA-related protein
MNCKHCGQPITENAKFCGHCGQPVTESIGGKKETAITENTGGGSKIGKLFSKKKNVAILVGALVVLLLGGGATGYILYNNSVNQKINSFTQYMEEYKKIENDYALGKKKDSYEALYAEAESLVSEKKVKKIEALTEKMEALKTEIIEMNQEVLAYREIYEAFNNRVDEYILTEEETDTCEAITVDLETALEEFDAEDSKKYSEKLEEFEAKAKENSINLVEKLKNQIEVFDKNSLYETERVILEADFTTAEESFTKGNYATAYKEYGTCLDTINLVSREADYYLSLDQVDETNYPTTKLYLKVTDLYGNIIENLETGGFSLWENNGQEFKKKKIKKLTLMNQAENLNIGIVADVSASMGYDMYTAEDAMSNLVSSMQFNIGDRAALYSFSDYVQREQYFTTSKSALESAIYGLNMGNMTAFYDGLAFALSEIIVQDGAKCIIAFTDGMENNSVSSKSYIIQKAQQYQIPIYIIGIGSMVDTQSMQEIAWQTGGTYQNIANVGDMSSIYQQIYREQKAKYVLEYTTTKKLDTDVERLLYVRYDDGQRVIRTEVSYVPEDYTIDGFIFHDSDSRYLTEEDLDKLTEAEVRIALNEIYARRGYIFQTAEDMKAHFAAMDWYEGTETNMDKVQAKFNKYETKNVDLLVAYEIKHQLNGRVK